MKKKGRKEACLKYLAGATVSYSPFEEKTQYVTDDFKGFIEQTFRPGDNPIDEGFTFETSEGELKAPAQICVDKSAVGESWAVSPGFQEDIYFVFNKPENSPSFHLFGLLEGVPRVVDDKNLKTAQEENIYLNGKASDKDPSPRPGKFIGDSYFLQLFRSHHFFFRSEPVAQLG